MVDDSKDDTALEALFSAAKAAPEPVSDDFLARLNADMDAAVPVPVTPATQAPTPWFTTVKGWFAASGLSGAAVLGLWIGFVMPDTLNTLTLGTDDTVALYTFLPGADLSAAGFDE